MKALSAPAKLSLVALLGAAICVIAGISYALIPTVIEIKVKKSLMLFEGSYLFEVWKEPPVPIYMQFYVFNVTNSEDILNFGAKPILQQLGPYTYREYRKKRNFTWSDDNRLMTFYQDMTYVFLPNMSVGSEEDKFTTINIATMTTIQKLKNSKVDFVKVLTNNLLYKDGIFTTITVDELFFKGFKVDLADKIHKLLNIQILPNASFGVFFGKNNSDDGEYVIHTGIDDVSLFGKIFTWKGSRYIPYWKDEYCGVINGSDLTLFPPFLTKKTVLYGIITFLCRGIYATFQDERVVEGIKAYRFTAPYRLFAAPHLNPDNRCYCNPNDNYTCHYSALMDVSRCNKGAPVILSMPHFYLSESVLQDAVIGLNPNKYEHETSIDVEPISGVVLNGARRIQVNVDIGPVENLKITENLPKLLFPIFWANESFSVTPALADSIKARINVPLFIATTVIYSLAALGALILLCASLYGLIRFRKGVSQNMM